MADDVDKELRDLTQWTAIPSLEPGHVLGGRVGSDRVLVWRSGRSFKAFGATCPHLGGPLDEGIIEDGAIRCPWHHACFDLTTGAVKSAPAFDSLPCYRVDVSDGHFAVRAATKASELPAKTIPAVRPSEPMVIVGGGAAAFAAANALRRHGWQGDIAMFSDDDAEPYDRTLLTKDYLDGHFGDDRLPIAGHSLAEIGVRFESKTLVEAIEPAQRKIRLKDGRLQSYGKLLLATGAAPRRLDVPGADLPHVLTLRSLTDCRRVLSRLEANPRIAVVGGSFIAMEAAASLRSRGLSVTVVAPEQHPMEKVFGRAFSDLIVETHRKKGVELHLGSKTAWIEAEAIVLENGERIAADLVLVGIGVTPRMELAKAAGLKIDNGVAVDSRLRTSADHIFAAGDIASWPDPHSGEQICVEHWVVAERQGEAAAANIVGTDAAFEMVPFFWTKHFDLAVRYVGHAETWEEIVIDGDLSRRDAAVHFRKNGRDLAIATVGRDQQSLRTELMMEKRFRRAGNGIGRDMA